MNPFTEFIAANLSWRQVAPQLGPKALELLALADRYDRVAHRGFRRPNGNDVPRHDSNRGRPK